MGKLALLAVLILFDARPAQAKFSDFLKALFGKTTHQHSETSNPQRAEPGPESNYDENEENSALDNEETTTPLRERIEPEDDNRICGNDAYEIICGDTDKGLQEFEKKLNAKFREKQIANIPDEKGQKISVDEMDDRLDAIHTVNEKGNTQYPPNGSSGI